MPIPPRRLYSIGVLAVIAALVGIVGAPRLLRSQGTAAQGNAFHLEEATIADVHRAIQQGQITCRGLVQAYIDRARAYNGVSDRLVTADGAPIPARPWHRPCRFSAPVSDGDGGGLHAAAGLPTNTRGRQSNSDGWKRPPRIADVQQQYGMTVGTPGRDQINALGTLNIRGERSVTCKGDRDRHPSQGALPAGSPAVCEEFRKQPDALERAAELDAQYGGNPDLAAMPMYCIPVLVQGLLRHERHAFDGRGRRALRHRLPRARPYARRSAPSQGRDHLRKGGQHRVQRHPGGPGRPPRARTRSSSPTSATSAAAGRATRTAPTTRRARRRSARAPARAHPSAPIS